jgi:hypothetical protein
MITRYCEAKHVVPTYSPRARMWLSPRELREKARAETDRPTRSVLDPVEGAAAASPRAARSCQPRACNAIRTRQHLSLTALSLHLSPSGARIPR